MDETIKKSFAQMLKQHYVADELQRVSRTPLADLIDDQLKRRLHNEQLKSLKVPKDKTVELWDTEIAFEKQFSMRADDQRRREAYRRSQESQLNMQRSINQLASWDVQGQKMYASVTPEEVAPWNPDADKMKSIIKEILKLTTVHSSEMIKKDSKAWNKITKLCNEALDIK